MTTINDWADRVFVINTAKRNDRMAQFQAEADAIGLKFERFEAYQDLIHDGKPSGSFGCTSSHRALLEIISYLNIERAVIFEDDAKFIFPDTQQRFSDSIGFVPDDWQEGGLFLGAHFAEMPKGRVNEHCWACNRVLCTHAYAVSAKSARKMAPYIGGAGGQVDSQYGRFHYELPWYCLDPRLVIQRAGYSDLEERNTSYEWVFTTNKHTWGDLP